MSTIPTLVNHALAALAGAPMELSNPPASPPQGVEATVNTLLAWGKWIAFVCGVAGIVVSGIMMMLGRRNRSQMSADGAIGLPWVIGGLSCVVLAVPLVNNLFG
jgi:type IV secretory pathway VirB2 component (pilin)